MGMEVEGGAADEEAVADLACCWGCWLWVLAVGSSLGFGMLDFGVVPGRAFSFFANIFTKRSPNKVFPWPPICWSAILSAPEISTEYFVHQPPRSPIKNSLFRMHAAWEAL